MRTLIIGIGALGGIVGARLLSAGLPVSLAARDENSSRHLNETGLQVRGMPSPVSIPDVRALEDFPGSDPFDLIVLATKAGEAIELVPQMLELLAPQGVILPLQNGSVFQVLAELAGRRRIIGCLSNIGATMLAPGIYEQRNAGHLLIGEIEGGNSSRVTELGAWLAGGIEVRTTENFPGASWSKLLLNCSVTTIGAITGTTMREYIATDDGLAAFAGTYDEVLNVAAAHGVSPEPMLVSPIPPGWAGKSALDMEYRDWLGEIISRYGDLKPSMLQDFERNRKTEIEFINGHVVGVGKRLGIATPFNQEILRIVSSIESGRMKPSLENLSTFHTFSR